MRAQRRQESNQQEGAHKAQPWRAHALGMLFRRAICSTDASVAFEFSLGPPDLTLVFPKRTHVRVSAQAPRENMRAVGCVPRLRARTQQRSACPLVRTASRAPCPPSPVRAAAQAVAQAAGERVRVGRRQRKCTRAEAAAACLAVRDFGGAAAHLHDERAAEVARRMRRRSGAAQRRRASAAARKARRQAAQAAAAERAHGDNDGRLRWPPPQHARAHSCT
jgi:hypothetical protein